MIAGIRFGSIDIVIATYAGGIGVHVCMALLGPWVFKGDVE